jgi:hypothetical protein
MTLKLELTEEQIQSIIVKEARSVLLEQAGGIFGTMDGIVVSWAELEEAWIAARSSEQFGSTTTAGAYKEIKDSSKPDNQGKADLLLQAMKGGTGIGTDEVAVLALLANDKATNDDIADKYRGRVSLQQDLRNELSNLAWTGLGRKLETLALLLLNGTNWGEWNPSTGKKMTSGDKEGAKAESKTNYPTEKMKTRSVVQFYYNNNEKFPAFAFKDNGTARIVVNNDQNYYYEDVFKAIEDGSELKKFEYEDLLKQFLKTYPKEVYSDGDTYKRVFDNKYKGPTNQPGEAKEFTLEPEAAATNESRSLTEDMVLNPVGEGDAIAVTSSPGGGRIPSRGVAKAPTAAAGAPRKGVIYLRGPRDEIAKLQKTIKQMDPSIDLGKTGPNKDGVDGLFGSLTLIAWRELTNSKSTPANIQQAFDALETAKSDQPASKAQAKQVDKFADDKILYRKDSAAQAKEAYDAAQKRIQTLKTRKESAKNAIANLETQRQQLLAKANASTKRKEKRDLFAQAGAFLRIDNGVRSGSIADKEAEIKELDTLLQQTTDLVMSELWPNLEAARKELEKLGIEYRELSETVTLSEAQLQQIILEETNFVLKKKLNEAPEPGSLASIRAAATAKSAGTGLGSMGAKGSKAAKVGSAIASTGKGVADVGRLMGKPGQAGAGLFKLLGFGVLGRLVATFFSWPVMVGWQVWDEFVSPFTIEAERGDITKSYKQMAESQEASRMREDIDKAAGDFLIKVQEYVKGYEGFSFLGLILDLTGGPLNLISNFNTDIVGYITSKFTDNPVSAAIKKRRVEASRQFYKILQEYGPEIQSEGNIIPNSPQKVQELEQVLNAKISEFLKKEYDVLATTDMVDLVGRSIPTRSKAEEDLKAAAKPLVKACLDYYKFIGGAEASQGKEAGPTGAKDSKSATTAAGAAAGAAAARTATPKQATYTGRVRDLTAKVRDLLKSNGVKDKDQQDAWISWTKQTMKNDKTARDETILSVIEEWLGFTSERVMRENRDLMEGVGLVLPERGEYEFSDFVEWLGANNREIGMSRKYGLYNPRHLRRYLNYVRKFKSNEARAKRQDKRSQRISKKIEKNREQIMSLQSDLEKLGGSKKDQKKAERLQNKIGRLTGAEERKELRAKKVKLRKKDIRK